MSGSNALPMRYYRDPAESVQFDQARALYQRERCVACRHCLPEEERQCRLNKRPGKHWCGGFDER